MQAAEQKTLYQSMTRRYMLAVLIILMLSSGAWISLQSALSESQYTAYIVNISGRQRMLSQHIALSAHRLNPQLQIPAKQRQIIFDRLNGYIIEMRKANRQLSSGVLGVSEIVDLSPAVRDILFGPTDLSNRVIDYLEIAQKILQVKDVESYQALMQQIDQRSEPLLVDLNRLVLQYQIEGEERVEFIKSIELGVFLLTIFTLIIEILFIFRPMVRAVAKAHQAEEETLATLLDQVELRTIKLENANKKLTELAMLDPLTHLRNRLTMEYDIENIIHAFEEHHVHYAVCQLDLDWFKSVNDTYGHLVGDYVLERVARLLEKALRDEDRVYRSGGEEFIILLNRIELTEASERLEQVRHAIKNFAFENNGAQFHITVSIGLYHSSLLKAKDVHDVLKAADDALYQAKAEGRDRLVLFST